MSDTYVGHEILGPDHRPKIPPQWGVYLSGEFVDSFDSLEDAEAEAEKLNRKRRIEP